MSVTSEAAPLPTCSLPVTSAVGSWTWPTSRTVPRPGHRAPASQRSLRRPQLRRRGPAPRRRTGHRAVPPRPRADSVRRRRRPTIRGAGSPPRTRPSPSCGPPANPEPQDRRHRRRDHHRHNRARPTTGDIRHARETVTTRPRASSTRPTGHRGDRSGRRTGRTCLRYGHSLVYESDPVAAGSRCGLFTYVQDEASGGIGSASFYINFDSEADRAWLQELLTLVAQGRVEERWSLGCSLRALRADGTSEVFGQSCPVPWRASRPRLYLPYVSS